MSSLTAAADERYLTGVIRQGVKGLAQQEARRKRPSPDILVTSFIEEGRDVRQWYAAPLHNGRIAGAIWLGWLPATEDERTIIRSIDALYRREMVAAAIAAREAAALIS